MIFNIAIGPKRGDVMGVPFIVFLAPGITMMTVIQNAFANTTSSIMTAKVQGNIVDTLMPPLSSSELWRGIWQAQWCAAFVWPLACGWVCF